MNEIAWLFFGRLIGTAPQTGARVEYDAFKASAVRALREKDRNLQLTPPVFRKKRSMMTYSFGSVFVRPTKDNPYSNERFRPLYERQLTNEQLRLTLTADKTMAVGGWLPFLDQVDREIRAVFSLTADNSINPEQLAKKFELLEKNINTIYQGAVESYAKKRKLALRPTDQTRIRTIDVSFESVPAGAEIEIVKAWFYYRVFNGNPTELYWLDVGNGDTVQIEAGDYVCRARWKPHTPWQTGNLSLLNAGKKRIVKKP